MRALTLLVPLALLVLHVAAAPQPNAAHAGDRDGGNGKMLTYRSGHIDFSMHLTKYVIMYLQRSVSAFCGV